MNGRSPQRYVTVLFGALLLSAGGIQLGMELAHGEPLQELALFTQTPTVAHLRAYEEDLQNQSWLGQRLGGWMRYARIVWFEDLGSKALQGPHGWLFYKPGVNYLTRRRPPNSGTGDPVDAIRDFRDQLARRGVHLVVLPVPNKESVYPEQLSRRAAGLGVAICGQTQSLLHQLEDAGVDVVNLFELYANEKSAATGPGSPSLYLVQDSHWSPHGLERAAQAVARRLAEGQWIRPGAVPYQTRTAPRQHEGDLVRMLEVPALEKRWAAESVSCQQVIAPDADRPYQDDARSEVLVLGDSFLRIFQQDEPGSAGFVAHLARHLRQPVASLVNDGGGSTLVRQELSRRPELLENKKVVLWEFVEREIRFGTEGWQRVPVPDPGSRVTSPVRDNHLAIRLSWGHRSPDTRSFSLTLATNDILLAQVRPLGFEPDDHWNDRNGVSRAGGGDVDAITMEVSWNKPRAEPRPVQSIWQYLLDQGTPDQAARLQDDPGRQPDAPVLTILTASDGTRGFSFSLEQLARHGAMWLPDHDVFMTRADAPVDLAAHLASFRGERVLDRVRREPEAALNEWTRKWSDFGNPTQPNHGHETEWLGAKGHLTGLIAQHGSIYKFGVDRWGRVRPDHASPHQFRLDPLWSGERAWKGQRIIDGLPILATEVEDPDRRYEVEQFAAPMIESSGSPPPALSPSGGGGAGPRRGEVASVVFTRVEIQGAGPFRLGFRLATENKERHPELREVSGHWCVVDRETGSVWLMIEPGPGLTVRPRPAIADQEHPSVEFDWVGELKEKTSGVLVLKLAAPVVPPESVSHLAALDYRRSRETVINYWENWLARGARFEVPEKTVNDLFRANLWHALFLPRHRTNQQGAAHIDLPYSNFAYGQYNADWPINQAVYVDYMIYGLRDYFDVAEEELAAMYDTQQQPDGRVAGYANWGVYSPSMLYAVGQNFLLSGDRDSLERLLPASLRAADWCLQQIAQGQTNTSVPGLIVAPLNDLTKISSAWAFPNAYFVAGLKVLGRALTLYGHPRAAEISAVALRMAADLERAFAGASVRAPLVQLADGSWINYVPCDAMTPRRLLDQWYPTDVDTGPLHLARLEAIDPNGWLATAMLHDHEDNLFLNQWGMANEPVYNQQATVYLLRDEPEAVIRAFYSMMACAFSHQQLTPLEHRWAWGQYYMPPSTDGAWFELYRRMLVRETDQNELWLCQAVPRKWLEAGNRIVVERAPTYFGPVSFIVESRVNEGEIEVDLRVPDRLCPASLCVRLRHPQKKPIHSVRLNGEAWLDFDHDLEWIRISRPDTEHYRIKVRY